ncbi:hypothetical protein [Citrobacter freundii]|nr:hypothetical protein [Citrobacter freundii]
MIDVRRRGGWSKAVRPPAGWLFSQSSFSGNFGLIPELTEIMKVRK